MRWVALIVAGIALVAAASGNASSVGTKQPTDACLTRHHVLLTQHTLIFTSGLGMPITSVESFTFTGVPSGVVDNGALLFANTAAGARKAEKLYFAYYVREDVIVKHQPRKLVVSALKAEDQVIGNVFVQWNDYPHTAAAEKVLRGCLR